MTKARKLKWCNWTLAFVAVVVLVSSIQLEATGSSGVVDVWLHIVVGCLMLALVVWHLYLHFGWKRWVERFRKFKSPVTHWLAVFSLLIVVSAAVVFFHWVGTYLHSPIGAIHGKIGFVFLFLSLLHTLKRIRFYRLKK